MSSDDLLLIAFNLALLTYNLGVVLYSLPIPLKSVKRWGANLIVDGISTTVLISCFTLILSLITFLQNLLGADWGNYFSWIGGRMALVFSAFSALTYMSGILKYPYTFFLSSPINVVLGYLSATISALRLLIFLGSFILNYYRYLMLLGVVLYSLPMRVGKNSGAYLIAMSLVLYVGLPLMPVFVEGFQTSLINVGLENPEISGYVLDVLGNPVPNAVINLYEDGELKGIILTSSSGRYNLGGGYDLLPKEFNYEVELELYGFSFTTVPNVIRSDVCNSTRTCNLNITAPGILTTAYGRLLIPLPLDAIITSTVLGNNTVRLTLIYNSNHSHNKLLLVYPESTIIQYLAVDGVATHCGVINNFNWYGIQVNICEVVVSSTTAQVEINYESLRAERPSISERRIIAVDDVNSILMNAISLGVAFIFSLVFLPSLYITLLLSISASVARLLGGRGLPIKIT
ncbi:MAG: carboxypeptidase-like regulatory domain-containing protein [Sulfolobales archaeon]